MFCMHIVSVSQEKSHSPFHLELTASCNFWEHCVEAAQQQTKQMHMSSSMCVTDILQLLPVLQAHAHSEHC